MQSFDHSSLQLDRSSGAIAGQIERVTNLPGPCQIVFTRRESIVAWLDLSRMDQGFAVEAQIGCQSALPDETLHVVDVVEDPVQSGGAEGSPCGDDLHEDRGERIARRLCAHAEFLCQIVAAEDHGGNAGGACDRLDLKQGSGGLDHDPEGTVLQHLPGNVEIGLCADLWKQDGIAPRTGDGRQVVRPPKACRAR